MAMARQSAQLLDWVPGRDGELENLAVTHRRSPFKMTESSESNPSFGWRDALARERAPVRIATSLGAVGLAVVFGLATLQLR